MVKFGDTLRDRARPAWREHYVGYSNNHTPIISPL